MADRMKVLIAYDGSACADAALDDLRKAGLPAEADCRVVAVIENWLPPPSGLEIVEHIDRDQEYITLAMSAAQRVQEVLLGWAVKAEVCAGSPASVIIEKADEWKPNLIVLGAHRRSALGRLFFGSVSQEVLHEANCSVRVAREPEDETRRPVRLLVGFDGSSKRERGCARADFATGRMDVKRALCMRPGQAWNSRLALWSAELPIGLPKKNCGSKRKLTQWSRPERRRDKQQPSSRLKSQNAC